VVAAKTRSAAQIKEVIEAGAGIIGENYVQEAEAVKLELGEVAKRVKWHLIGHLQTNKVKRAVELFDMIETLDSAKLAEELDKRCLQAGKTMPCLIEINIAEEKDKTGIVPARVADFIDEVKGFNNIKIEGLMTMGPLTGDEEQLRHCFKECRIIFDDLKKRNIDGVSMKYLSMGMSGSYRTAIGEGANIIRLGEIIFGKRKGA